MKLKEFVHAIFFEYTHFVEFYSFNKYRVDKYKMNEINFNMIRRN